MHSIVAPGGEVDYPVVAEYRAIERANGGMVSCAGRIDPQLLKARPDVYVPGARWLTYARDTGTLVFVGRLNEPLPSSSGVVELSALGPAARAERQFDRLLYQSRAYSAWAPADGEPHDYNNNKHFEVDARGGRLIYVPSKGEDFSGGEKAGMVFPAVGEHIRRVAFTMRKIEDDGNFEVLIRGANIDDDGLGGALTEIQTYTWGAGNADGTEKDLSISGNFDLLWIGIRATGSVTGTPKRKFWLTDLRVNGISPDDDDTTSDIVRDICARLNVSDDRVRESGDEALPLDIEEGTYGEVLDMMALLSDWRWLFIADERKVVCDFAPWGRRVWTVTDAEVPADLTPQERYDRAAVPFRYADGLARGVAKAIADPNPLDIRRTAPLIDIFGDLANEDKAQAHAQKIADYLVTRRIGGRLQLFSVRDEAGYKMSAQNVHAGDLLYLPELEVRCRIEEVERHDSFIYVTLLEGIPFLERIAARRTRARAARGR